VCCGVVGSGADVRGGRPCGPTRTRHGGRPADDRRRVSAPARRPSRAGPAIDDDILDRDPVQLCPRLVLRAGETFNAQLSSDRNHAGRVDRQRDCHHGLLAQLRLNPTREDGAASLAEAFLTAPLRGGSTSPRIMNTCFKHYDVFLRGPGHHDGSIRLAMHPAWTALLRGHTSPKLHPRRAVPAGRLGHPRCVTVIMTGTT